MNYQQNRWFHSDGKIASSKKHSILKRNKEIKYSIMKRYYFLFMAILSLSLLNSCSDDDKSEGQPQLSVSGVPSSALFGDSISFSATVSDTENVPLSTLKAKLYYGEDLVSETVIRTKTEGEYSGKIFVPFMKNIPNGAATLKFTSQNIQFGVKEESYQLPLTRPDFPYLTLITEDGEYKMEKTEENLYTATEDFSQKVKATIIAPAVGERGNEIIFGWKEGSISETSQAPIPFSNSQAGVYDINFNTLTYEASPFILLKFAGKEMEMVDDNNYKVELELTKDGIIEVDGFNDLEEWWIDSDFIKTNEDGTFTFLPIGGKYRVTANFENNYFIFEVMDGNDTATLNEDGTGAIWIIGENIGKPSLSNETGWNPDKALCFAPISEKVYQMTLVAGETISTSSINFKFFHQKDWGGEYKNETLTTESNLVFVGDGDNGRDSGNLGLVEGKTLEEGETYRLTVDLTAGRDNAIMVVEKL